MIDVTRRTILRAIGAACAFASIPAFPAAGIEHARALAAADGWNPDETIPVGPRSMMVGDLMTDGLEFPAYEFYRREAQLRWDLSPLGPRTEAFC